MKFKKKILCDFKLYLLASFSNHNFIVSHVSPLVSVSLLAPCTNKECPRALGIEMILRHPTVTLELEVKIDVQLIGCPVEVRYSS